MMRRGFTLLETLASLVVAAIVTTGIATALRASLDASVRIRERAGAHGDARAALDILTADLSAAFLSPVNTQQTEFVGRPAGSTDPGEPLLSFSTLAYRLSPAAYRGQPRSDALLVEYLYEPGPAVPGAAAPTPGRLLRRERWLTQTAPGEVEAICEMVADVRLRYLADGEFMEEWTAETSANRELQVRFGEPARPGEERTLPRAVEVTLLLAPEAGSPEGTAPRLYRTVVPIGAEAAPPFEPETVLPPPQQAAGGGGETRTRRGGITR